MARQKVVSNGNKLEDALELLNKQYGVGTVLSLDSKPGGTYDVISTGSIGFDYITLGIGGFAKGKVYELMGWEGTGKSTICGHAVANCQANGGKAGYIDGEHAVDRNYFMQLGVNTSEMIIAQPSCGEEGFNIALQMIETGEIDLIIIDSDSSLIPKSVLDGEIGEHAIGKKAKLNSSAYPKLKSSADKNNVCIIVISQYREKIGVMFGNPTTTQGGHALKFYTDCRIEVSKSLAKDGDTTYGNITKIKSTKNKMSPPYRLCQFEIVYGKGIDTVTEIMVLLNEFNLGKQWGKSYTYNETKFDLKEFKQIIKDNPEFYDELKEKVVQKIKKSEMDEKTEEITEMNEL